MSKKSTGFVQIVAAADQMSPTGFHITAICIRCDDVPLDTDAFLDNILDVVRRHLREVHGVQP